MFDNLDKTFELAERLHTVPAGRDELLFDEPTELRNCSGSNDGTVISESATALPTSDQDLAQRTLALIKRIRREHRNTEKFFVKSDDLLAKSLCSARAAGEALVELKELVGRGKWGEEKKRLKVELGGADTTLSLYMRIHKNWDRIEAATDSGQLQRPSLRRVAKWLSQKTAQHSPSHSRPHVLELETCGNKLITAALNNGKSEPESVAQPKDAELPAPSAAADEGKSQSEPPTSPQRISQESRHLVCNDRDLARAISRIEAEGFLFHSTNVACVLSGSHLFLVSGVRGGAVPATDEFKTWIEAIDREEAINEMSERLSVIWPGAVFETFLP